MSCPYEEMPLGILDTIIEGLCHQWSTEVIGATHDCPMKKHVISLMTWHIKILLIQIFQRQLENALEESDAIYENRGYFRQ